MNTHKPPLHIGLVVWCLFKGAGGIERVGAQIANALVARGYKVTVIYGCTAPGRTEPFFPLDAAVHTLFLPERAMPQECHKEDNILTRIGLDIVVAKYSSDDALWFVPLLARTGIPLVYAEHNVPTIIEEERWERDEHRGFMLAADAVTVLLDSFKQYYPPLLRERITVISNPLAKICFCPQTSRSRPKNPILLAAGRFIDSAKQFSLLLEAFASLSSQLPDWNLVLCGDGKDRAKYEALIERLGLGSRVTLPGMVADMEPFYSESDIFCIPSRHEGFPLVINEAQGHGLPVVGFAACPGVNELIIHNESGLLVEEMTPKALAHSLALLMNDAALRRDMGAKGREHAQRFTEPAIIAQWEDLLQSTAANKGRTRLQQFYFSGAQNASEEERYRAKLNDILRRENPREREKKKRLKGLKKYFQAFSKKLRSKLLLTTSLFGPTAAIVMTKTSDIII